MACGAGEVMEGALPVVRLEEGDSNETMVVDGAVAVWNSVLAGSG